MNITYVTHSEIDMVKWDLAIGRAVNGNMYGLSCYLNTVCPGWDALVADDYKIIMPLPHRKKLGFHYLFPPFFIQQLGIYGDEKLSVQTINSFLHAIPAKFKLIELYLNHANATDDSSFQIKSNNNYILRLNESYDALAKTFGTNHKRNLKDANAELQIALLQDADALIQLFRENKGKEVKQFTTKEYQLLKQLITTCQGQVVIKIHGVTLHNLLVAGCITLEFNNRIVFLFSAVAPAGRTSKAMFKLVNHLIQINCNSQKILDFEGSNNTSLASFYKGFGSELQPYLFVRKNLLPRAIKWLKE
ncbi:MAG: hypothetical protein IPO27_11690 [Bacteroidetes bacterium]|nr:hypothetical protein [Bacteroidota bacterium]